ncbi:hypothetical protein [Listeria innocua]|uniref:hypothetical protein n=1 Tax=Listeria innocua TaxID=1642 RepID=UPI00162A8456|nr:hypothetical protein [Listeria innocua]MBC1925535.1 hypothetical protein [Listeria innocua]
MIEKETAYLAKINFYDNEDEGILAVAGLTLGVETVFEVKATYAVDETRVVDVDQVILTIFNAETNELLTQVPFVPALELLGAEVIASNDEVELFHLDALNEKEVVEKLGLVAP